MANAILKNSCEAVYKLYKGDFKVSRDTYAFVLQGCARADALIQGKTAHTHIIKTGFGQDKFLGNHLLNMYAKCDSIVDARQVLDKMPQRNVVSWTAIIAGCVHNGHAEEALKLFEQMQLEGVRANDFTLSSVINACSSLGNLEMGKCVHGDVRKAGLEPNLVVGSALVDMYAKCGSLRDARDVFDKMPERDVVSWTSLIAGYAEHGGGEEALDLFVKVLDKGLKLDQFTFASVLRACSRMACLVQGKQVHGHIIKTGFESNSMMGSALIDMYTKCGDTGYALIVFSKISEQNVVSWTAMIAGYAQHGLSKEALQLFDKMVGAGIKPNAITFVAVLNACSQAGLVNEGCHYFDSMTSKYGISPTEQHYTCMVNLLGRAGCLSEAEKIINKNQIKPIGAMWGALLSACRTHGNTELAKHAADRLLELKHKVATTYVALSNAYAADGRWDDVAKCNTSYAFVCTLKEI